MLKINLLPSQQKKEAKIEKINHLTVFYGFLVVLSFSIFIVLLYNVQLFLLWKTEDIEREIENKQKTLQIQETKKTEKNIQDVNKILGEITQVKNNQPKWSGIVERLSLLVPSGVQLKNLSANWESRNITIIGFSPTRSGVLSFESTLKESPLFEITEAPLSNLIKPADIDFRFELKIIKNQ